MTWNAVAPLAPLLLLNALFLLCLPIFALWARRHGLPSGESAKQHSGLAGRFLQGYLNWMVGPIERALVRARVAPSTLTALSVLMALAAAGALALGRFGLGGWLYIFTGIVDIFDGRVARATGTVSEAGAFADSVSDRAVEAAIFSGLAWYYRDKWVLALVLGALVASFLVSYTRARGEALGISGADIGRMQRPERIMFLGSGMVLSPVLGLLLPAVAAMRWPAVAGLGLVALASAGTAWRRFRFVLRKLGRSAPVRALRPVAVEGAGSGRAAGDGAAAAASAAHASQH